MEVNKMDYESSKDVPTHGQWDNNNDDKAAHGGLRHPMLKDDADKTAPPSHDLDPNAVHSTMVQGQRNKKSSDRYGRSTVPTANVLSLVRNDFKGIREDIDEFTALALECEPFSKDKYHYQYLLSVICKTGGSDAIRQEALRGLLKTSDWSNIISSVPSYQEVINESFSN